MSDLIWLSEAQMRRIEPYFPLSHRVPRVDDRRIISGIIFVIRNGVRWRDAPAEYGPPKGRGPSTMLRPRVRLRTRFQQNDLPPADHSARLHPLPVPGRV